jgi:hypothetical protein
MKLDVKAPLKVSLDFSFEAESGQAYFILDNEGRPIAEIYELEDPDHEEALANLICELLNKHFQGVQP